MLVDPLEGELVPMYLVVISIVPQVTAIGHDAQEQLSVSVLQAVAICHYAQDPFQVAIGIDVAGVGAEAEIDWTGHAPVAFAVNVAEVGVEDVNDWPGSALEMFDPFQR